MNTGETIALIKAFGNGGSGSLPPVTPEDNGKVLAVKDGAWAADSNLFIVGRTGSSLDYTYAEIKAAIDAGREVELSINNNRYSYAGIYMNTIYFTMEQPDTASYVTIYGVKSDNTYVSKQFQYLPIVANADVGKELVVKGGRWQKQEKKFIVTLTPTAQDFSGTMDYTVSEIYTAYEAGQEIWFKVAASGFDILIPMSNCSVSSIYTYPSFDCRMVDPNTNVEVCVNTGVTNDGTRQDYSTTVYSLTPAS